MKKVIVLMMSFIIVVSTFMLGGCDKSDPGISKKETPYVVVEKLSDEEEKDIKNYLTEENTDVIKVKETLEGYFKAYINIDYRTTDGTETYGYLSDEILESFNRENDAEEAVKAYNDYSVVMQLDNLKVDSIKFTEDENLAEIKGFITYKYLEGTDAFFKQQDKMKDEIYQQSFRVQLKKEADVWKLSFRKLEAPTLMSK